MDSVLQKNPFVKAVHSSTLKKSKKKRKQIANATDATECGPEGSASTSSMSDLWGDKGGDNCVVKKKMKPSPIPAIEVEPSGCSYNPTDESHQVFSRSLPLGTTSMFFILLLHVIIAKEDEEKQKRHLQHVVATNEKAKSCPPHLGRHKFEPALIKVLLTEERIGSIRKLKRCCTLVKDHYKSFCYFSPAQFCL